MTVRPYLFDLPARRFYIFGLTFWPQDFFYMAWLLIIAGVSAVLLYRAGRALMVRLCLSANRVDQCLCVDGAR